VDRAAAVAIATGAHLEAFAEELDAAGIDVAEAVSEGRLVLIDAVATLAELTPGGRLDPDVFHDLIGGVIRRAGRAGRPVRAYGEMVALLWDAGHVVAAIDLEKLWNELGRELRFSLLCAYPSSSVCGSEHAEGLREVCALHSSVSRHFVGGRHAPRAARRMVGDALERWDYGDAVREDAQLVLSELTTNAVHADSPFTVAARRLGAGVRISVKDSSVAEPTIRDVGLDAACGRGMRIVAALADDWGFELTPDGKSVWANLRV
jgi:hypothetical protein